MMKQIYGDVVHAQVVSLIVTVLVTIVGGRLARRIKATSRTARNATSNANGFEPSLAFTACRGIRPLNPVEAVRARAFATRVFAYCGIRKIIKWATKYNVPSFALYRLANLGCVRITVVYAFHANDGGLMLARSEKASPRILNTVKKILDSSCRKKLCFELNGPHNATFAVPADFMRDVVYSISGCVLKANNNDFPKDGNYILHLVEYYRSVVL